MIGVLQGSVFTKISHNSNRFKTLEERVFRGFFEYTVRYYEHCYNFAAQLQHRLYDCMLLQKIITSMSCSCLHNKIIIVCQHFARGLFGIMQFVRFNFFPLRRPKTMRYIVFTYANSLRAREDICTAQTIGTTIAPLPNR